MPFQLKVTDPRGEYTVEWFEKMEEAQAWADDIIAGMDTSEARETAFEIKYIGRNALDDESKYGR